MSTLLIGAMLAADPSANATPCLLVGPSQTKVVVGVTQSSTDNVLISKYGDYVWPFEKNFKLSRFKKEYGIFKQDKPRADGLVSEFSISGHTFNVEVYRDGERHEGLPMFSGSCPSQSSSMFPKYIASLPHREDMISITSDEVVNERVSTSPECQVASAAGWVSKFSVSFTDLNTHIFITPHDKHIWPEKISYKIGPQYPQPPLKTSLGMIAFEGIGSPKSMSSAIWLNGSRDGQSASARVEFYLYTAEGSDSKEWLSGICSGFAKAGAAAS